MVSHDRGAPGSWTQRISTVDPRAFPRLGAAPWTNHHMLPLDFTAMSITVDPHNARVLYAAGCTDVDGLCDTPRGGHLVLRSGDGGRSWQDMVTVAAIARTPALKAALRLSSAAPTAGYAVAVDPHTSRRLYVAVRGLGVLRSEDAGRTWFYVPQPQTNNILKPCELLIDPRHPATVYELAREGRGYRTTDAGRHWAVAAELGTQTHSTLSSLTLAGHTLYVTAARGIYASKDGGMHWRLAYREPMPGDFDQSIRGAGGWLSAFGPQSPQAAGGLYATHDGGHWQLVADTDRRGPQYYGSLDFHAMGGALATRMWEDHTTHIVFTAGPLGGLYRWQSSL